MIVVVNDAVGEIGVVVCAVGLMFGDLYKLWCVCDFDGKGYYVEYGYLCMGYEIFGGMGIKFVAFEREVYVMIGDGFYLMLLGDLMMVVAEGVLFVIVFVDNYGYVSIGVFLCLVGGVGFGIYYCVGVFVDGELLLFMLLIDLVVNVESFGACVIRACIVDDVRVALVDARGVDGLVVIYVEVDCYVGVLSYEGWWDVFVVEVFEVLSVQVACEQYDAVRGAQRSYVALIEWEFAK